MNVRIIELGRIGDETKGNASLASPDLEVSPKTQRRDVFISDTAV